MLSSDYVNGGSENKRITSMQLVPLFPLSYLRPSKYFTSENYADIRPWVQKAIAEEEQNVNDQLWRNEPSAAYQLIERFRLIKFFRKHQNSGPLFKYIADRLVSCDKGNRCCSGACPECGRLLQRSFVRKSKHLIRNTLDKDDHQLVAITIIPAKPIIRPRNLHTLDISKLNNMCRSLKRALAKAGIETAIGAIDFSYNEDKEGKYEPFCSAHYYVITSVANQARVKKILKQFFPAKRRIPRPVKISPFKNSRLRRSYAFKLQFNRRIGIDTVKSMADGTIRKCRNTSRQRLRVTERLELFGYLDQIGFAERFIFLGVKPIIKANAIKLMQV
jgi:hypothetical protein